MESLSFTAKQALYGYLSGYLTPHKQHLFEQVAQSRTRHLVVAVEDIHKSQNASAVVRTCDCFGVQEVHIIEEHNPYEVSSTIAMGADQWLDLHKYDQDADNTQACLDRLKARGFRIIATTPHAEDQYLADVDLTAPAALFFGGELKGLSDQVLSQADERLKIPLYGFTESFNISVSAAIILQDLTHRLRKSTVPWQLDAEAQLELKVAWAQQTIRGGEQIAQHFLKDYKE